MVIPLRGQKSGVFFVPNYDRVGVRFLSFHRRKGILRQEEQRLTAADRSSAVESSYRAEGDLEKVIRRGLRKDYDEIKTYANNKMR